MDKKDWLKAFVAAKNYPLGLSEELNYEQLEEAYSFFPGNPWQAAEEY